MKANNPDARTRDAADLRVLFVSRKWPPSVGGMETLAWELSRALSETVDRITCVTPAKPTDGSPRGMINLADWMNRAFSRVRALAPQYDVIHCADLVTWPLARTALQANPDIRTIITLNGQDVTFASRQSPLGWCYNTYLRPLRGLEVDAFVPNSRWIATQLEETGLTPHDVIPLGCRAAEIPGHDPSQHNDRIVFAGRIIRLKGASWFAENVMPLLPDDIHLDIIGPPARDREELKRIQQATVQPNIHYHGVRTGPELHAHLANALAVVVPNRRSTRHGEGEGFGMAALEPASIGTPVIASRREGLLDAVEDKITGYLVDWNDPESWADKIKTIRAWTPQERHNFATRASEMVRTHYSWERVADDYAGLYLDVLSSPRSRS